MTKLPIADLIARAEEALSSAADPAAPAGSRDLRLRMLLRRGADLAGRTNELAGWLEARWEDEDVDLWIENLHKYEAANRCLRKVERWLDGHAA